MAVEAAPDAESYLRRCAGIDATTPLPAASATQDDLLEEAWRSLPEELRIELGQVFTPRPVARQLLVESVGDDVDGDVLDPSCGGGIFLIEEARRRVDARGPGHATALHLLATLHGIDIHPVAVDLARLFVGLEVVRSGPDHFDLAAPDIRLGDALEEDWGPVDHIVGNPPYLEAKRMPKDQRKRLRKAWPRLYGAWDLYVPFLLKALDSGASVAFVLPNKFQVARYAEPVRKRIAEDGRLKALVDLSELPVFRKVGVYPILLVLGPPAPSAKACFKVRQLPDGTAPLDGVDLPHATLRRIDPPVFFTLPATDLADVVVRLLADLPPLRDQVEVRSTCSFHKKGLREQFVNDGSAGVGRPYLGGKSYARRNEIRPWKVAWQGSRIDYDVAALKAVGNPLPPLSIFERPKVVYCQHARSLVAWADLDGVYVTKDVYPVAFPKTGGADATAALAAMVNSRVFSAVYSLLFRGIQVGGGYLHFLPVYLKNMPLPELDVSLAGLVREQQDAPDPDRADVLDVAVSDRYGLTARERRAVIAYADDVLGFSAGLERT